MRDGQPGTLGVGTTLVWPARGAAWFPLRWLLLQPPEGPWPRQADGSEEAAATQTPKQESHCLSEGEEIHADVL